MAGILLAGGPAIAAMQLTGDAPQPNFDAVEMKLCGVFVKQYWLARDGQHDAIRHHKHDSDHVTAIALGTVRVLRDGVDLGERHAPALVEIKAGTVHSFQAVTDRALLYCIHQLEDGADRPAHQEIG